MQLNKSQVIFNQEKHTYILNGAFLSGITGMIERQLFPDKLKGIPQYRIDNAAEKGSYIHECCEIADSLGVIPDCEEAKNYLNLIQLNGLIIEDSEYLVSDNEHYASSIDKVYRDGEDTFHLGDIKTTYKLDKEYVRWQLSIYAYLFELQNPGAKVDRLFAIWLRGSIAELIDVERISSDVIESLLTCDINGIQFVNPYALPISNITLPSHYQEMELSIIEIEKQAKYWTDKKKELTDEVMKEMVKSGVYNWKGDSIQFIRKKDSIRKSFDKEKFEKDYPGVYNKYLKESPVVGSVTLKVI